MLFYAFMSSDCLVSLFGLSGTDEGIDNVLHNYWPVMNTCIARWATGIMATLRHC